MVDLPADQYRDRLPTELSGGQKQRVGFARALASKPQAILMDEPFGARSNYARRLATRVPVTSEKLELSVVLVTHDTEAVLLADRIAVMHKGELVQVASPKVLLTSPTNAYVAQLIDTPRRHSDFIESPSWKYDRRCGLEPPTLSCLNSCQICLVVTLRSLSQQSLLGC